MKRDHRPAALLYDRVAINSQAEIKYGENKIKCYSSLWIVPALQFEGMEMFGVGGALDFRRRPSGLSSWGELRQAVNELDEFAFNQVD